MRDCPWCGHKNLNVYAYCQRCGRGFDGPAESKKQSQRKSLWPFGKRG